MKKVQVVEKVLLGCSMDYGMLIISAKADAISCVVCNRQVDEIFCDLIIMGVVSSGDV